MIKDVLSIEDILNKKFKASQNGYNPFEVDKFLDTVTLTINALNTEIKNLNQLNDESVQEIEMLKKKLDDLNTEFTLFKNKFKYIKETDFIDNRSSIDLLRKVNVYSEKLNELGVDVNKL